MIEGRSVSSFKAPCFLTLSFAPMFASVFRATSARLFRPRCVQPLFSRGFADAAVAPAVDKKAPAKKKAAQSDNASESSMQLRRQQNLLEESDQYFDWEAFVRWLDAPAPADPRSKEEIAADEQVSRIYSKQNAKRYIAQQQFFDSMLRCQMEAVACLPVPLRERALVFDPILPPVHPRIGAPRQYPIASRLQVERIEDEDDDDKDGKRQTTDDGEEEGGAQHR